MTYLIKPRKGRRKSGKKEIKSKFNNQKTITNMVDINPIILKSFKCEMFKYINYKTKVVNLD